MEILLGLLAAVIVVTVARRGMLHPGDYLVAAALAVLLAGFTLVITPHREQGDEFAALGVPATAVSRSALLQAHEWKIVAGAALFAASACASAALRRRVTPERYV